MTDLYVCNHKDDCGDLADHCRHARPHVPVKCGNCGTWCSDSNGLCGGGVCSGPRAPKGLFEQFCDSEKGRPRCNVKVDATPAVSQEKSSSNGTENPLESLHDTCAFWSGDWSNDNRLAWVYGIICGWDEALDEICQKHNWSDESKARLIRLHKRFKTLKEK